MKPSPPILQLTWAGFDAAVDLIAAQCVRRDRSGVWSPSAAGLMLAVALAERLGMNVLQLPTPGMLLVDAEASPELRRHADRAEDADVWVWVDNSAEQQWNSAMKVSGLALLLFPWQQAPSCCRRQFVQGFDD